DATVQDALDGQEAVAEVRLGRRACADARAGLREQIELVSVRVRRMDDGRARPEAAALGEQLDRAHAVLRGALVDLTRLLVGVHVQWQVLGGGVRADLLEPVARARAHGVGGDADPDAGRAKLLDAVQVLGDRGLAEAVDAPARVRGVEQHELDARVVGRGRRLVRLREPEVVELPDRGVAGVAQLAVDGGIARADVSRRQVAGRVQHHVPPRPEVNTFGAAAQRALERVAVRVYESG